MWTNKRIALLDVKSGAKTDLTASSAAAFSPVWSPGGSRIAYVAAPDIGSVGGGEPAKLGAGLRRIWVMDADGANKRQLTGDEAYRDERPLWSADGSHLLFVRLHHAEDAASLWLLPLEGGPPTKVADLSRPQPDQDPPLWFGYYGYVAWDRYFDWWTGD